MRDREDITKMLQEIEENMKNGKTELTDSEKEELKKIQEFMDLVVQNKLENFEDNRDLIKHLEPYIKILSHVIGNFPEMKTMAFLDCEGMAYAIINTALLTLTIAKKIEVKE